MRISKATHLTRLLQTQDVVLAILLYLGVVDLAWLGGYLEWTEAKAHLWLTPAAAIAAVVASRLGRPSLHRRTYLDYTIIAARFTSIVLGGLLLVVFVGKFSNISRVVLISFALVLFAALLINRLFLSWWYLRGRREHTANFLKVLVIGSGPRAQMLMKTYREHSEWGIEIVGIVDPEPGRTGEVVDGVRVLGCIDAIHEILSREVIDEVVVCLPRSLINNISEVVASCEEQAICIKFMADVYDMETESVELDHVGHLPLLSFEPVARDEGMLVVKRVIDLLVTIAALPVLLPFFALIALLIKLESPGPVFFLQERVGLNKRSFKMIKFRSMYTDAEARLKEIEHLNEADGPIFKMKNDPRVTRMGRFIRRTSIDELPQLFNVLLGHVSLIGPRPMSLRDVELFSKGVQRKRFSVKPGLACLREVSGRSALTFDQWLELDLKYIDEWSIWLDLKILLMVVPAVLKGDGAS